MVSMEEQKKRRARRKFTDEFKARAVRLVLKEGQTAAQVARDLDLVESVLHGWVRQAKIDRGMGPAGALTSEEREELSRLRKENRVLKEERGGGGGPALGSDALPHAKGVAERVLRLAPARTIAPRGGGRSAGDAHRGV